MFNPIRITTAACLTAAALLAVPAAFAAPSQESFTFTLSPGASEVISLPKVQKPMQMLASLSAENHGTQTPSALVGAIINEDPSSRQLTWIGTNGDGTQAAGTTLSNPAQVAAFAFNNCIVTAAPGSGDVKGKLIFTQSATTTSVPLTYYVVINY